ncbi:MAG: phosphoglucomutase/phosphomannomutase family protein [Candidatus Melainabacteria bacterium]|nr:phosphoglucomutase/phosphomannomutase family protein [Candidatus Melainabacteria bacterium]
MSSNIKFGTDGWRDVIADGFTFKNVRVVSIAIGKYIEKKLNKNLPVLIGYDTRFLANEFAKACTNELLNLDLNVQLSQVVIPTPVIAFWAAKIPQGSNGAIQFTASHNPPKYCGLKYITNYGGPAPVEITDEITNYIDAHRDAPLGRLYENIDIRTFDPKQQYIDHLKSLIDFDKIKKSNLKIIYDPMYGAGNNYLDYILKEAGCETITIHNKRDPLFGNLFPEPKEEFLNELKQVVVSKNANLGLATDGDADRLAAIDNSGNFYSANKIGSMLVRHLVKNKKLKGKVVRTMSTTHLIDSLAKRYDLEAIETKVGFKWICEIMLKENVLIGIEESGGISILNHIPDKDAILSGMLLTEMLAYENKTLSQIYSETIKEAGYSYINDKLDLHLNKEQINSFISSLKKENLLKINNLKTKSINTTEGVKYLFEDGSWFFARPSGTEPLARVYFEATSDKVLNAMKNKIQEIVNQAQCQK